MELAPETTPDATTSTPEAAAPATPAPVIEFLHPNTRMRKVRLKFPVKVDGAELHEVSIHRLTGAQVLQMIEHVNAGRFAEASGMMIDLPAAVYAGLDDDDIVAIDEVVQSFFPRRLQGLADASDRGAGDKLPA